LHELAYLWFVLLQLFVKFYLQHTYFVQSNPLPLHKNHREFVKQFLCSICRRWHYLNNSRFWKTIRTNYSTRCCMFQIKYSADSGS
uniref:Secreted protein n=1 Tax=Brugia timori TaxID=42155 RepID=A0A0R3QDB6_9BILA